MWLIDVVRGGWKFGIVIGFIVGGGVLFIVFGCWGKFCFFFCFCELLVLIDL